MWGLVPAPNAPARAIVAHGGHGLEPQRLECSWGGGWYTGFTGLMALAPPDVF